MLAKDDSKVMANFFLDGAKIIFASLVVGVFVPGASGTRPWLVCLAGVAMTILFLSIAVKLSKTEIKKL